MIIAALNPDVSDHEKTNLSTSVAAAATSLTVRNNQGFANTDKILIGEMSREKSEIATINGAVSAGTSLSVAAITFPHSTDDPVYKLRFDKVRFYRSTTGINGSYSLIATVDIDVDNANDETTYDDSTGSTTYYYKNSYYNSVSTVESQQSDPMLGGGYSRNSVGSLLDEVFEEVGDKNNDFMSRQEAIAILNDVNDTLVGETKKPYRFLKTSVTVDATAATDIDFPADMFKFNRLDYRYNLNGIDETYSVGTIDPDLFRYRYTDNDVIADDQLQGVWLDEEEQKIRVYPPFATTRSDVVTIHYWKYPTEINSEADEFETPTRLLYKLYLMGRYYLKRSAKDAAFGGLANFYFSGYTKELNKLPRSNRIDEGTPQSFKYEPRYRTRGLRRY